MKCPHCQRTMIEINETFRETLRETVRWCSKCGTLWVKDYSGTARFQTPALAELYQALEGAKEIGAGI
jgi:transposase-like protein